MIFSKTIYFVILSVYLWNANVIDAAAKEDYYQLLGVEKTATAKEIKKAFRRLALQYHPDKNKDEGAEEQFKKIVEAYEILGDETKRKQYDQFGHGGFGGFGGGAGGFGNFDANAFYKQFDELFKNFGQGFQSGQGDRWKQGNKKNGGFNFNFDDLFSDLDLDELKFFKRKTSTNDGGETTEEHTFGDGESFFGTHFQKSGDQMNFGFSAEKIVKSFTEGLQKGMDDAMGDLKSKMSNLGAQVNRFKTDFGETVVINRKSVNVKIESKTIRN